jgi:hypothetical protein
MVSGLEQLNQVGPDNDFPLPKRLFELVAIVAPPTLVQYLGHHLENYDLVFFDFPVPLAVPSAGVRVKAIAPPKVSVRCS